MNSNTRIFNVVLAGIMVLTAFLGSTVPAKADVATLDLFISEYVEGSSNNKAVEIYNPTEDSINLADGVYTLEFYFNASTTAGTTILLTGTIEGGGTYVVADNDSVTAVLDVTDQQSNSSFFSGDDSVVLKKDGVVLDSIGKIAQYVEWGSGDVSTKDNTIRRKAEVCAGDTNPNDDYDPSSEWDGFAQNTFDGLGSHTANCGSSDPEVYLSEMQVSTTGDDWEFVELAGTPEMDLSEYTLVGVSSIAGDTSFGVINAVISLSGQTIPEDGYWFAANGLAETTYSVTADMPISDNTFENDPTTYFLVTNFSGAIDNDLDTDDDGTLDVTPWDEIVDSVNIRSSLTDYNYDAPAVGPDNNGYLPSGTFRCPNSPEGTFEGNFLNFNNPDGTPGIENYCNQPIVATCNAVTLLTGQSSVEAFSAIDEDGIVISAEITSDPVTGITLGTVTPAAQVNEALTGEVNLDNLAEGTYSVELSFANDDDPAQTATCTMVVTVGPIPGICAGDTYEIGTLQGTGSATPLSGQTVTVSGIVTDVYHGADELGGFFVQDSNGDGNDLTSDGIYVYAPSAVVNSGDIVQVTGLVSEYYDNTQISSATVNSCTPISEDIPTTITPTELSLPVSSLDDFEKLEGMLVTFSQDLTIAEYYQYDEFNQIVLTPGRVLNPTAIYEPGSAEASAALANYNLYRIYWDDARTLKYPDSNIHPNGAEFNLDNLYRGGDQLSNVTGVIYYGYSQYRLNTPALDYAKTNPRTETHDDVGGTLKVASFNVLNYFTTLNSRGANTAEEFTRQRDKIIAAIAAIDADIVGLIEIENNDAAIVDLVTGLNAVMSPEDAYDYVDAGDNGVIGTDVIKVAFIYKPATVSLVGDYAILDSSENEKFDETKNRPMLTQTFEEDSSGEIFTVAVNHLKSKGSSCSGDPDTGDGSGNCNITRTEAAEAIVEWLATDPTGSGDPDFLIIGDLNSYDKETPIDAILEGADGILATADDYTDLIYNFVGENAYSYVYDGRVGYLDHALSNLDLSSQVTGTTIWHINADEPDILDYVYGDKSAGQIALYAPDAYRSSDHDPVIIGLDLGDQTPVANAQSVSVNEDGSIDITLTGSDAETETAELTFAIATQPTHGTVALVGNVATYEPAANYNGSDSFTFTVNDGTQNSAPAIVTITVNAVNDAPVAVADSGEAYSVVADQVLTMVAPGVLGNDTDLEEDALTAVLNTNVSHGTLTLNADGSFTYDPNDSYVGTDSFTYHANDGELDSNIVTVTIVVAEIPVTSGYVIYLPMITR